MSSTLVIIAGVAIVAYTIATQVLGAPIRAKRLAILPAIVTVVGAVDVADHSGVLTGTDVALIVLGAVVAAAIGLALGWMMRLERRDGWLWGQLPKRGLWLWVAFFASRGILVGIAHGDGAHVAAGTDAELLILGLNRVAQAVVVGMRAASSGIPFAPESDGSRPLSGLFGGTGPGRSGGAGQGPGVDPPTGAGQGATGPTGVAGSPASVGPAGRTRLGGLLGGGSGLLGAAGAGRGDRRSARRSRRGR